MEEQRENKTVKKLPPETKSERKGKSKALLVAVL